MEHDWGRGSERGVGWRGAGVLGGTGRDGRRRLERLGHPKSLNMRLERRGMPLATCSGSSSRRIARLLLLVCTIFRQVLGLMGASRRPPPPRRGARPQPRARCDSRMDASLPQGPPLHSTASLHLSRESLPA